MEGSPRLDPDRPADKPPRDRWRIPRSLRFFVVVLLILTGAAAWIVIKGYRQTLIVRRIKEAGGLVSYYCQVDGDGKPINRAQPRGPAWLRKVIGDDFFDEPYSVHINYRGHHRQVPDAAADVLVQIVRLPRLKSLSIEGIRLTTEDLGRIAEMRELRSLYLGERTLDDYDLEPLRALSLEWLALPRTRISDKGLRSLIEMHSLRYLDLTRTRVTDRGVLDLGGLQELRMLRLERSKTTLAGAKRLKTRLPRCKIVWQSLEMGRHGSTRLN